MCFYIGLNMFDGMDIRVCKVVHVMAKTRGRGLKCLYGRCDPFGIHEFVSCDLFEGRCEPNTLSQVCVT